jgi:hypothetical protein
MYEGVVGSLGVVGHLTIVLVLGNATHVAELAMQVLQNNLLRQGMAWIDAGGALPAITPAERSELFGSPEIEARALAGWISLTSYHNGIEELARRIDAMRNLEPRVGLGHDTFSYADEMALNVYDSVKLYAWAAVNLLGSMDNGTIVTTAMTNVTFPSFLDDEEVRIDGSGEPINDISVINFQPQLDLNSAQFDPDAPFTGTSVRIGRVTSFEVQEWEKAIWPGMTESIPPDTPLKDEMDPLGLSLGMTFFYFILMGCTFCWGYKVEKPPKLKPSKQMRKWAEATTQYGAIDKVILPQIQNHVQVTEITDGTSNIELNSTQPQLSRQQKRKALKALTSNALRTTRLEKPVGSFKHNLKLALHDLIFEDDDLALESEDSDDELAGEDDTALGDGDDELGLVMASSDARTATFCDGDTVMLDSRSYWLLDTVEDTEHKDQETDPSILINIVRIGDARASLELLFECINPPAGMTLDPADGKIHLGPGVFSQTVQLWMKPSKKWKPQTSFDVSISLTQGEARLGLSTATVAMCNTNKFPNNVPVKTGSMDAERKLMTGFLRERWEARGKKAWISLLCWVYLAFHANFVDSVAYFLLISHLSGQFVTLEPTIKQHYTYLIVTIIGYVISFLIDTKCQVVQQDKRGRSGSRRDIRTWLFNKFLELEEDAHENVNEIKWLNTATVRVEEVINNGWFMVF